MKNKENDKVIDKENGEMTEKEIIEMLDYINTLYSKEYRKMLDKIMR